MHSRKRHSKKPPDPAPVFFIDRSLGAVTVPQGLAADGWNVVVMAHVYGERVAQGMDDPPWIEDATHAQYVILTKDYKSLRYRAPFETVKAVGAKIFAIERADLPGPVQLEYFRANMNRIVRAARRPGPYIYKVREQTIDKVWP